MKHGRDAPARQGALSFDYELDAPPAKVWRALTVPEFVARWLTARVVAQEAGTSEPDGAERSPSLPVSLRLLESEPGRSVRYLWREDASPFPESIVTFRVAPSESGGTRFRVVHEMTATVRAFAPKRPANRDGPRLLLAA
jgi:uncharacterized protein YndB with AHSA1/START domain